MSRLKRLPKRALIALLALAVFVPVYFLSLMRDQDDPAQHQPVPRRRFRPSLMFLVLPALGLFLAVYLLGPAPGSSSGSVGPVRIEDIRINQLPQASSPSIEIEVELRNHDDVVHEIQAWWFLARPGANRPWSLYAYRSSIQAPYTLAAGETVELSWREDVTAEPGTYELSVWVHTLDGNITRHSDGLRWGDSAVRIDSQWSRFIRRAAPPAGLQVTAVDLPASVLNDGLSIPSKLPLTIVVSNDTAAEMVADVQWFLYRQETRLPWSGKPAYTSKKLQHQVFAPMSESTITTSETISLWPGEYMLRVVVTEAADEGGAATDDLFLNDGITMLESDRGSTLVKAGPASGPVQISSLTVDTENFRQGKGSVMANLRNQSESEQEAILWWFLSRPGTLEPWVDFAFQSRVFGIAIAPQQHTILDLSDESPLPTGTYELSVWIHTVDGDGEERPSDGAWFSKRIEIH